MSLKQDQLGATILPFPDKGGLPVYLVAAVIGQEPGTVRQWLFRGLFGDELRGQRKGRERQLNAAEGVMLRILAEYLPLSASLKKAWAKGLGLTQAVLPFAQAAKPYPFPVDLFAVEAWGHPMPVDEADRVICRGQTELGVCVMGYAGRGWPHVHIFNVSEAVYEVLVAWDIAVLGPDRAAEPFVAEHLPRLAPDRRPAALAMFEEVAQRVASARPNAPAKDKAWTAFKAESGAA